MLENVQQDEHTHCQIESVNDTAVHDQRPFQCTLGGDLTLPTRIGKTQSTAIILCSVIQVASGFLMTILAVVITGLTHKSSPHSIPILWWTGFLPVVTGLLGVHAASKKSSDPGVKAEKSRKYVYRWGMLSMMMLLFQYPIMGVVGNFSPSHYNVQPLTRLFTRQNNQSYCVEHTQPLLRCYCQLSVSVATESQGLQRTSKEQQQVGWKNTGFESCQVIENISVLYYCVMIALALLTLFTICGWIVSLRASVCASPRQLFEHLEEDAETESNMQPAATPIVRDNSYTEMRTIHPGVGTDRSEAVQLVS